jgi:hypothetical protein
MKVRKLATSHPLASIGTSLGVTLYRNESNGHIVFKDTDGTVRTLIGDDNTTYTQALADITTAQTDITNLESFQDLLAPANIATGPISITVDITSANILAMNGTPVEVLATQGADTAIEFISGVLIYDYDTAQYGGGGDVTLEYSGGAAVSTTIAAANSFGATGDKVFSFMRLNAAGGYTMPVNTGLDITNATGAFTQPGSAAGVGRLHLTYRVHTLGL